MTNIPNLRPSPLQSPIFAAKDLFETRYQGAAAVLVAGSVVRGEASQYSDLDLVVIFPSVRAAYRESFTHMGWPVEAFIHDLETLRYFFYKIDQPSATSTLCEMVKEGLEVPGACKISDQAKLLATEVLKAGPPALTFEEIEDRRYSISELIDDLRDPRTRHEMNATAARVYGELADFYCRSRGGWTSAGKGLLKRMRAHDPLMARRFSEAFDQLFQHGLPAAVIGLSEEMLAPYGGFLFDAYRREVPPNWRGV
ncbi:nucleotidyltransferase domain-containing protein [soil metagenome]